MKTYTQIAAIIFLAIFCPTSYVQAQLQTCDTAAHHVIVKNDYVPACYQFASEQASDSGAVLHADAADLYGHFWIWGCMKFGASPVGQNSLGLCLGYNQSIDSLAGSLAHPSGQMVAIEFDTRSPNDQLVVWIWKGGARQVLATAQALPNGADLADDEFHYVELAWYPPDPSYPNSNTANRFKLWIDGNLTLNVHYKLIDSLFAGKTSPRWWTVGQSWAPYGNQLIGCVFEGDCGAITLPTVFASMEAVVHPSEVKIKWQVASDLEIDQYVVERSFDGVTYSEIASLPRTNSNRYAHLDQDMQQGVRYYRIAANEKEGTSVYSEAVEVVVMESLASHFKVMPNPVTVGQFAIQSDRAGVFTLRTIQGVTLQSGNFGMGETTLNVETYVAGVYLLGLKTDQSQIVQRLMILEPR